MPDTTPREFVRDFLWAHAYWRHFRRSERLERIGLVHAWRYAAQEAPRKRRKDRIKYA